MDNRKKNAAVLTVFLSTVIYSIACVYSPVAWSPDGKQIAFNCWYGATTKDSNYDLWILDLETDRRTLVENVTNGILFTPVWEGNRIYYAVQPGEKGGLDIRTADRNGKTTLVASLTDRVGLSEGDLAATMYPGILVPRASRILVTPESGVSYIRNYVTGERLDLYDRGWACLSPDGRHAWCEDPQFPLVRIGKAKIEPVPLEGKGKDNAAWSPDGSHLYTSGEEEGARVIFRYDAETGRRETVGLVPGEGDLGTIGVAPGERRLALGTEGGLFGVLDLAGGGFQALDRGALMVPTFSPDGRFLVCRGHRGGELEDFTAWLVLFDLQTGARREIFTRDDQVSAFALSLVEAPIPALSAQAAGGKLDRLAKELRARLKERPGSASLLEAVGLIRAARRRLETEMPGFEVAREEVDALLAETTALPEK